MRLKRERFFGLNARAPALPFSFNRKALKVFVLRTQVYFIVALGAAAGPKWPVAYGVK